MFFILSEEHPYVLKNCIDHLKALDAKKSMIVEINHYRKNRTQDQNRLMWLWYSIISKELGYTKEQLHEMMKARVLGLEKVTVPNGIGGVGELTYSRPKSSAKLTTKEMSELLNAIEWLAAELNIKLPQPFVKGY